MGLFKGIPALTDIHHPVHGTLTYVADDESYLCTAYRFPMLLAVDNNDQIQKGVLDHLQLIVDSLARIEDDLAAAKSKFAADCPEYAAVAKRLVIESFSVSNYRGKYMYCLISLSDPDNRDGEEAWRFELQDLKPVGLGFDR